MLKTVDKLHLSLSEAVNCNKCRKLIAVYTVNCLMVENTIIQKLYEESSRAVSAIILSTLLYGADVWPLTATLTKSLDAAHHRWQRSILGISWKDRITNVEVRARTGQ